MPARLGTALGREAPGLGLLAVCGLALVWPLWNVPPQVDDAFISYRYAANWVAGQGLVFNPGERVEGFTNPLWVVLVAAGLRCGLGAKAVAHGLGLASGLACLVLAHALVRTWAPRSPSWLAALAPLLLLLSVPFVRWTIGGLETPLFAAALAAAFLAASHQRIGWSAAALGVASAVRPEGALAAAIVFGAYLLPQWRRAQAWRPVAVFALVPIGLTVFRWLYYGALLPNTFYAKAGGIPLTIGLYYLSAFLLDGVLLLVPGAVAAFARETETRPALVFATLFAAYVVAVGGDGLGESRFLVPLLPLIAAAAVAGTSLATRRTRRRLLTASLAGALFWTAFGAPTLDVYSRKRTLVLERLDRHAANFEQIARERAAILRERGESGVLVATGAVGAIGFYADVQILDILGLLDARIARTRPQGRPIPGHQRSDAGYVLERRPHYILIPQRGSEGRGRLGAVRDLWEHPDLERLYTWDREIRGYRRRDLPPPPAPAPRV